MWAGCGGKIRRVRPLGLYARWGPEAGKAPNTSPGIPPLNSEAPSLSSLVGAQLGSDLMLQEAATSEGTREGGRACLARRPRSRSPPLSLPRWVRRFWSSWGRQGRVCEAEEQMVTSSLGRWPWGGAMAWHVQQK